MKNNGIDVSETESSVEEEFTTENETYDVFCLLGTEEVAEILKCSLASARQVMSRADFPLIMVGKNFRVSEKAFAEWLMKQHV